MSNQIPRPQLGIEQYHDLVLFQAFTLMNTQLALARTEADLKMLAEQLVTQTKRTEEAEAKLRTPVEMSAANPSTENCGGAA